MKRYALTLALAIAAGVAIAQVVTTPGPTTLHTGNGTGKALQTFAQPGAVAACGAAVAASGPGKWQCKDNFTNACAPAAAASSVTISCAPLLGSWSQTTTYKVDAKTCAQVPSTSPASAPTGACTAPPVVTPSAWVLLANEGQPFTVTGTKQIRIGVEWATAWSASVSVTGTGTCSMAFLKVPDPKPGSAKVCQVSGTADTVPPIVVPPPVTPPASAPTPMPPTAVFYIEKDPAKWPAPLQNPTGGWPKDMLVDTTEKPAGSDIGAFRTACQLTGWSFNDPIVYPGQPGKSHLHANFGNYKLDAYSTGDSLFAAGNSSCRGGTINRSAYWVPAMIDTRTGKPVRPMLESNFYYKTGYTLPPASIAELPIGLRMISGDASGNPGKPSAAASYACVWDGGNGNSNWQPSIPTDCKYVAGRENWLIVGVVFPQCWDGVNLDSPDHKSHMKAAIGGNGNNTGHCPTSHPVALPEISYQVQYLYTGNADLKAWRLSSDNYDVTKPAGYSGHGDYMMAWKPDIVKVWTQKCDREQKDCHSHLLGDGRAMVIP